MSAPRKARTVFACQECGYESPKWMGRCPDCGSWNTFLQQTAARSPGANPGPLRSPPVEMASLSEGQEAHQPIGLSEFDRVLGGGIVSGSLALIGGDPGIGKSTLLLQVAASLLERAQGPVVYLSGEESPQQLKLRAARLGIAGARLFVIAETDLDTALPAIEDISPALLIVDSIQTVSAQSVPQAPGSIVQLRECTMRLMRWAKGSGVPVLIVGHVTKDGEIAGPRLLEHIVDVVLYLEGERFSNYRVLRGVKNRFGSVAEIGVFEMTGDGMLQVQNPSELFLAERSHDTVGSAIVPTIEGSRPLLVEVQALTTFATAPVPRRTANGLEQARLLLISAVLSRRAGLALGNQDIIASVVGGLRVQEPAADLALALAIASSLRDLPVPADLVALGEIGLSGELRSVPQMERRLAEAARLGFRRCLLPRSAIARQHPSTTLTLLPADNVKQAFQIALDSTQPQ